MKFKGKARLALICVSIIVISLIFAGQSFAKIDPKTAVGIWLFDEGKGDIAKDSSGNGNDGKINGAKFSNGKISQALSFDGSDDFVEIPARVSLDTRLHITIAAWIYPTKDGPIVNYQHPGGRWGTHLWITAPSNLFVRVIKRDGAFTTHLTCPISLKAWHHVATIYGHSSGVVSLFLDGKECNSLNIGVTEQSTHGPVFMGKAPWDGRAFKELIDEVAIFNVVLSKEEIQAIMNKGLSSILAVSPRLYYQHARASTIFAHVAKRRGDTMASRL
ncbi:TPA: LamG domain-containing protein, partial [Candidatus Poribacteria bacterium]|nr:LamG domain-containing protein [Candidatus Poribacteria bacterium]